MQKRPDDLGKLDLRILARQMSLTEYFISRQQTALTLLELIYCQTLVVYPRRDSPPLEIVENKDVLFPP